MLISLAEKGRSPFCPSLSSSWHPSYWRSNKRWSRQMPRCFIISYSFRKFLFRICHWKLLHHHLRQPQWRSRWFVLLHLCWWELFRVRKLTSAKWGNRNCNRILQTRLSSYKLRPIKHKESHFFLGWTNPIRNFRSIVKTGVVIFVLHF